jgi:hypothetical protein
MRQQSRQPDVGPVGCKKGLLSWNIYSKRESWTIALSQTEQRAKGSLPEKNTPVKKELLTLAPGNIADGIC